MDGVTWDFKDIITSVLVPAIVWLILLIHKVINILLGLKREVGGLRSNVKQEMETIAEMGIATALIKQNVDDIKRHTEPKSS